MNAILSQRDVKRFAAVLGRLNGPHDGERANAAAMADKHVRSHEWDRHELIARPFAPGLRAVHQRAPKRPKVDPKMRAIWLLSIGGLSRWEAEFLSGAAEQAQPLSPWQIAKLEEITERIEQRCAEGAR